MRRAASTATLFIASCLTTTGASVAFAHDGHGLGGTHWHATDVWGFVVVGALSALAIWIARKGK
ncbi:MAG: hypothetical protein U5M53_12965 [Rhodoferax sp.]|nr:hypothetical protein [Rhodoferax sp.]